MIDAIGGIAIAIVAVVLLCLVYGFRVVIAVGCNPKMQILISINGKVGVKARVSSRSDPTVMCHICSFVIQKLEGTYAPMPCSMFQTVLACLLLRSLDSRDSITPGAPGMWLRASINPISRADVAR